MGKNIAVFGIYPDRQTVEKGVAQLRATGFWNTDVSVVFPEKNTEAHESAGGALGWLTSIGALAIPGMEPFAAAGPIVGALAGAGASGAPGGIAGALVDMGIPEFEAKRFEGQLREGGILIAAHCDARDWVKRTKDILRETGARHIWAEGEKTGDLAKAGKPRPRMRGARARDVTDEELDDSETL